MDINYNFQQKVPVCLAFHFYFLLVLDPKFLPALILIRNFLTELLLGKNFFAYQST